MKKSIEFKLQRETIYIEISILDRIEECSEFIPSPISRSKTIFENGADFGAFDKKNY